MNEMSKSKLELNTLKMILLEKPSKFNGMGLARLYSGIFHETWNWHEFSEMLDHWNAQGIVKVVGHNTDGMCIYVLK
jgi:hypothetical protein